MPDKELSHAHQEFCRLYIYDWNATKAYQETHPDCSYDSARALASKLLTNVNILDCIKELQKQPAKNIGVSREMIAKEFRKLAFSDIAHLHNTWISLREFEELTDEQRACIAEISTQKRREGQDKEWEVDYVKIKLHDKQKALENLNKMFGFNEPDKVDVVTKTDMSSLPTEELILRANAIKAITNQDA